MHHDGAATLALIDFGAKNCFVQRYGTPNSCAMFEGANQRCNLPQVVNFVQKQNICCQKICSRFGTYCQLLCYQKTDNTNYIGYAVALELQSIGGLAKLCFNFAK